MTSTIRAAAALAILIMAGCTWVEPTPGSEEVRVLPADKVGTCKKLGDTTSSLVHKVAGINRSEEKVKKELETLASNSAVVMGGDTVVATTPVNEGEQSFDVYKCVGVYSAAP